MREARDAAGSSPGKFMTVVVEHTDPEIADTVRDEIRTRCEVRATVDIVAPHSLPKSEMKTKRVIDDRG